MLYRTVSLTALLLVHSSVGSMLADEYPIEKTGTEGNGNFVVGPDYKIDPDLTDRGNPKGKSFEFSMRLADSKIFPGNDSTLDPSKPVRELRKIPDESQPLKLAKKALERTK